MLSITGKTGKREGNPLTISEEARAKAHADMEEKLSKIPGMDAFMLDAHRLLDAQLDKEDANRGKISLTTIINKLRPGGKKNDIR